MSAPEHTIKQFDLSDYISETITFDEAVNLTGAGLEFLYKRADEDEFTIVEATLSAPSPSIDAATSATATNSWANTDLQEVDYFQYVWRVTLTDGTILERPVSAATDDFPDRVYQSFRVTEAMSSGSEAAGSVVSVQYRPLTVADIDAAKALPWSANYNDSTLLFILSDLNDAVGSYTWDADITAESAAVEDPTGNNVIPLTDSRGGGWRRKGL